jgi:hypothetical protein
MGRTRELPACRWGVEIDEGGAGTLARGQGVHVISPCRCLYHELHSVTNGSVAVDDGYYGGLGAVLQCSTTYS